MSTPFQFAGSLQLPGDQGLPLDAVPISLSSQFTSESKQVLNLVGSGTMNLPLGTVATPGLKGLLIKVDPNTDPAAAPIVVKTNSQTVGEEISPGGFMALGSPTPLTGILAISITWTSLNVVRIWALA